MTTLKQLLLTVMGVCLPLLIWSPHATAATVSEDGGITLWMSFDNADETFSVGLDTTVDTDNAGCEPSNDARAAHGAEESPSSCPDGDDVCSAKEKLNGDLQRLAEYIYQSTEGANHLEQVYVEEHGKSWRDVDIRIDLSSGISTANSSGWDNANGFINMRRFWRRCIHDVMHHEFSHYFHNLPDRYASTDEDYYRGRIGADVFDVTTKIGDPNTVMNGNYPHQFVDDTNAKLTIEYTPPGELSAIEETLTPDLLADADPGNDGPFRAHHGHTSPFAQDEWSLMPEEHIHLEDVHDSGDFPTMDIDDMPSYDVEYIEADEVRAGAILLLDRSGSMSVMTDGRPASELVQEAGLAMYHSADSTDFVGTKLYNSSVEELFEYQQYDPDNDLDEASFRIPTGTTNIALALQEGIDALIEEHGFANVDGGRLILMSDGRQTIGGSVEDQTDRARALGIKINTLSFGAADASAMEDIASATSGSSQELADREDANELKVQLSRFANEIRGYQPVFRHKGRLNRRLIRQHGNGEKYEQRFVVPPKSRGLKLYAFADLANAADYTIELVNPFGVVTRHRADAIAQRGRFNGANLDKAMPGIWTYRLLGEKPGHLSRDAHFEILASVEHLQLDTNVRVADASRNNIWLKRVNASLNYRYPIADARAVAYIYVGKRYMGAISLYDDGQRGGDSIEDDGNYSNIIDLRRFGVDKLLGDLAQKRQNPSKIRFDVWFMVTNRSQPAPYAHYETGTKLDELQKDFEQNIKSKRSFSVWDTLYTQVRKYQRKSTASARLLGSKGQLAFPRGKTSPLFFEILGSIPNINNLRVSLGPGIKVDVRSVKPYTRRAGVRGYLHITPTKRTRPGVRPLMLQFGHTKLKAAGRITVR